jgi:hypothetical protein
MPIPILRTGAAVVFVSLAMACGDEPPGASTSSSASPSAQSASASAGSGAAGGGGASAAGGSGGALGCSFSESFDVGDESPWPAPWSVAGGVAIADVQGGRGRLVPVTSNYSLARMVAPLGCSEAEVTFSFEMTSESTQGVGLYLRQNGGYLQATNPSGSGYAAFVEAFREPEGIGVWREVSGEEQLVDDTVTPFALEPGTVYRARFRLSQASADQTRLEAKVWAASDSEPATFSVDRFDTTPALQGGSGGIALDSWSSLVSGDATALYVDDIVVSPL